MPIPLFARARLRFPIGVVATACACLLAGCAVGPDFVRPQPPAAVAYAPGLVDPTPTAGLPPGEAQRFSATPLRADWWTLFGSPHLNALVAQAFAANPTVEAAQAALRIAQENVAAQRGFFFPTVQAGYSPSRTKIAGNLGGNSPGIQGNGRVIATGEGTPADQGGTGPFNSPVIYNFHTAQLTVGYSPDVFGANRRQVEAAQAQTQHERWQLEATYLTLASNVVAAAIQEAVLRQQITLTEATINANVQALEILQRQLKAGYASRLDVSLQETALSQARQQLPPLRKQFEQTRNLLRALSGGRQDIELPQTFDLATLQLPRELPLSLPSELVRQRPDVLAAEALLESASAQVGIAIANRLPQFSIDASLGGAASRIGEMFWPSGRFFSLAGNLALPLFDAGTLRHRQRAAEEGLRQADASYRATVITALQNVADTLHAIRSDAEGLAAATEHERTTRNSRDLVRRQLVAGYADRLALLSSEQAHQQAMLDLAQAQATRLGDTVALFQALGGGWWSRPPEATL